MSKRLSLKYLFFAFSLFSLVAFTGKNAYSETMEPKALFEKRCSRCHSLDKTNRAESADYWRSIVLKMKKKFFSGIKDAEVAVIIEYLIKTKGLPVQEQ
jgi:cytochrome c2